MLKRNKRRAFSNQETDAFRRVEMLIVLGLPIEEALSLIDVARPRYDLWKQISAMSATSGNDQTVRLKKENSALRKMLAEMLMSAPSLIKESVSQKKTLSEWLQKML